MKTDDLNEHELNLILDIKNTFQPEDWKELHNIIDNPKLNNIQKITQLETLKENAHNRYIQTHGTQPNGGIDQELENLL